MASRKPIPKATQAKILLESRRRCCICYGLHRDLEVKKGQIAHIDRNASNPDENNLIFLCLDHHDEYDSQTSQSKSLTELELKHFQKELAEYWAIPDQSTPNEIKNDVLKELSLVGHLWKNEYMTLYPGGFRNVPHNSEWQDVWDMFRDTIAHKTTTEEWKRYLPLFSNYLPHIVDKIQKLTLLWGQYLDDTSKHKVLKVCSQLESQARMYPVLKFVIVDTPEQSTLLQNQIKGTLAVLGNFSRDMEAATSTNESAK